MAGACSDSGMPVTPNVRVSLSPARAKPGDAVSLRITPPPKKEQDDNGEDIFYGVETWFDAERDGQWRRVFTTASSINDEAPARFEALGVDTGFPSISFTAQRSERFFVPDVDPGVYRISKPVSRHNSETNEVTRFVFSADLIVL